MTGRQLPIAPTIIVGPSIKVATPSAVTGPPEAKVAITEIIPQTVNDPPMIPMGLWGDWEKNPILSIIRLNYFK